MPEPFSTGVAVVAILRGIFGLFTGRVSSNIKRALEGIRGALASVADQLYRLISRVARLAGAIFNAAHALWIKVLRPILEHVDRLQRRLALVIDRVLRPYLELIRQIRDSILLIYESIFRPLIQVIGVLRQALILGRILRIGAARRLDARLARLQGKVARPILDLLAKVNEQGGWLNVLVTAQWVLGAGIFLRTLSTYRNDLVSYYWAGYNTAVDPDLVKRLKAPAAEPDIPALVTASRLAALEGSGPLASDVAELVSRSRRQLGL